MVGVKCPFCRQLAPLPPAYGPGEAGGLPLKQLLHQAGRSGGQLLEIPPACGDCDCANSAAMVLRTLPCEYGCYGCDGSAIEVFTAAC